MCPEQITFDTVKKEKTGETVVRKKKPAIPDFLKDIEKVKDINKLAEKLGYSDILPEYIIRRKDVESGENPLSLPYSGNGSYDFIYFDDEVNVWTVPCNILLSAHYNYDAVSKTYSATPTISVVSFKVGAPKILNKLPECPILLNRNIVEIYEKASEKYPYLFKWSESCGNYPAFFCVTDYKGKVSQLIFLLYPEIEILSKAGYTFADRFSKSYMWNRRNGSVSEYNRLINHGGTNPSNIFKTSKDVYTALKNNPDLKKWDIIRKMDKFGRVSKEVISLIAERNYDNKSLESFNVILKMKYDGKTVFSWTSLLNYLDRLDTYEAIDYFEALPLLADYLRMCDALKIEPKIDGDSLKREHDVAARLMRNRRDEIKAEKMKGACNYSYLNYEDDKYIIRAIKDYDDLMNEAMQQHNCLACYADRIINGNSKIFVMREKSNPDKSFISIELSGDNEYVRQRYFAYNRPVTNTHIISVINKWHESVKKKTADAA